MSLFGPDLAPVDTPVEWEWIAPALADRHCVTAIVPGGYERYLRIDHGTAETYDGGGLPAEMLESIASVASHHTTTPDRAWFAIWEGYGWLGAQMLSSRQKGGLFSRFRREKPFDDVFAEFEERKERLAVEVETLPELRVPNRNYLVLCGPVDAAKHMHDPISPSARRPPDLWWPSDRAWFVGSDPDLSWTYLAGPAALTDVIVEEWSDRVRVVDPKGPVD